MRHITLLADGIMFLSILCVINMIYVKRPFQISVCKGYYEVGVADNDGLTYWHRPVVMTPPPPPPPTIQIAVAVTNCDITYCIFQNENTVFRTQAKAWSILRVRKVFGLSLELKAFPNLTSSILLGRLSMFLVTITKWIITEWACSCSVTGH